MSQEDFDITFGRMSIGPDPSDWDEVPRNRVEMTANGTEGAAGDELDLMAESDHSAAGAQMPTAPPITATTPGATPVPAATVAAGEFEEEHDAMPMFNTALAHFSAKEPKKRVVRIDNEGSYTGFVADKAAKEVSRRVGETDVLGAMEVLHELKSARTIGEAAASLPQVPLPLPDFATGNVICHRDGDHVVVTLRFAAADGEPRYATAAAKPHIDVDDVMGAAMAKGYDPIAVLGAAPAIAAVETGKRLVRDVAGAALDAMNRLDVVVMGADSDPVLVATGDSKTGGAPLAAVMYVQQQAANGDPQATKELAIMHAAAAAMPGGQQVVAPMLAEGQKRLNQRWEDRAEGFFEKAIGYVKQLVDKVIA